ncbi:MAG: hypothetical protein J6L89_08535 [Clostridia bacterium]|nr:hypothetical protein [Clostridia bacterium]
MKIVDRIVCALLSFGVILAAFFAPLIHWLYQITVYGLANGLLGGVTGEYIGNANDQGWTEDDYSLYNIYKLLKDFGVDFKELFSGNKELNPNLEIFVPLIKPVLVFFAITLVIALATGIVSLASKAKTPRMILSGAGIVSLVFLKSSFDKLVLPIIEGKVTLGSLLDIPWLGMISKIEVINLSGGWVMMIMLFAAVILWNISYILTSDEKNKAMMKKGK